ncbi:hypothetical protein FKM82_018006 [Ascaphus truei]
MYDFRLLSLAPANTCMGYNVKICWNWPINCRRSASAEKGSVYVSSFHSGQSSTLSTVCSPVSYMIFCCLKRSILLRVTFA